MTWNEIQYPMRYIQNIIKLRAGAKNRRKAILVNSREREKCMLEKEKQDPEGHCLDVKCSWRAR